MNLTDTHIHLYAEEFDDQREKLINEAVDVGVTRFLLPNIDSGTINPMIDLCKVDGNRFFPMFGLHPCYVNDDYKAQLNSIKNAYENYKGKVVAIGEIGLDFYWEMTFKEEQEEAFREQAIWAHEKKLPISIHSRESTARLIEILRELSLSNLKGVFHCYSGDINQADEIMNLGFYFGVGGVVTFKNSGLAEIISQIPAEYIILETDGPYLAPTPHRGKRNNPSYLKLIAQKVAEIKKMDLNELAEVTNRNVKQLFGI